MEHPYIMSGGSSETIEACARSAKKPLVSAYRRKPEINADMIGAWPCGSVHWC